MAAMLPHPTASQADWASTRWPGFGQAQLEEARALYVSRCSACHNLEIPTNHSQARWEEVISTMAARAKMTPDEKERVWRYILTMRSAER